MGEHNCYAKDTAECIKKKAYELWEQEGRKQGRDLQHWLQAEKTVTSQKMWGQKGQKHGRDAVLAEDQKSSTGTKK